MHTRRFLAALAMIMTISAGAAPAYGRGTKTDTAAEAHLGGMTFAVKSVTVTARDRRTAPFPEQETNPGRGTLEASWPQARSDSPEWKAWNSAVLRATQELVNSYPGDAKKAVPAADGWARAAIADQELSVTGKVLRVGNGMVSTRIYENLFLHGGAHPVEEWIYFHWLLNEKRELQASDVFQPGSAWEDVVKKFCTANLHKQFPGTWPMLWDDNGKYTKGEFTKGLNTTVESPRNWKVGPAGLTIVFPEYAVSPRVATPQDITIPWAELRPFLRPDFAVP